MPLPPRPLTALLATLALSGCAHQAPLPPPPTAAAPEVATTAAAPDNTASAPVAPGRPFSTDTLAALLEGEFAGYRQRPDIALHLYTEQARQTRDPGVVARAATIAQLLGQAESLEMSQLWTEVAPDSPEAWYLLVLNSLRMQQFERLMPALEGLLALQPDADLEQVFLAGAPTSPNARSALLATLDDIEPRFATNPHILFARALLQSQAGARDTALLTVREARRLRPGSPQINLLEAKLLSESGQDREAAQLLASAVAARPDSYSLRLNYARSLVRSRDLAGAEREFRTLVERHPGDASLRLGLALIAFENRHDEEAHRQFETLINHEEHGDEASYYLGQLHRRRGDTDAAILAYERVLPGPQFLPAQAEISRLLARNNQLREARQRLAEARAQLPDLRPALYQLEAELLGEQKQHAEARALLDEALAAQPDNLQLLMSRAMSAEREGRLDLFEADVRDVLRRDPDNASALNALGYTLLIRTTRRDEAETYIRRAHEIKPDDPAIIDSLGWAKFLRGDVAGALQQLQRAYALFQDDEIAAHLGEVLWASGQRQEARRIWDDGLRRHPGSEHILDTRRRLEK
ncbi:MAG: tetratricopeptide repeat protein [Moraxellaceae bacterium]